ncbi:MAG: tetratricopeptide repeat protein [Pseudomonadales bacterium]|nr:tetratricopeptide repeat protein [Pseudomonadales bacterium]
MDPYLSEQEQIEAIKSWWRRHGSTLLITLALLLAAYWGWQLWQKQQADSQARAAALYQNMEQAYLLAQKGEKEEQAQQLATFTHLAGQLKSDYPTYGYARFAAWMLAKAAVARQDYQAAEKELEWVLAHLGMGWMKGEDTLSAAISRLRLAQLKLAQKQFDAALAQLDLVSDGAFEVREAELRGDVLMAKGDAAGAVAAYTRALAATAVDDPLRGLTEMKLDDAKSRLPKTNTEQKP